MGDGGSGKEPPDGRGGDKQRVYSKIRVSKACTSELMIDLISHLATLDSKIFQSVFCAKVLPIINTIYLMKAIEAD
ncbi:hypothetical protein JHK87_043987 [Glycine soja]|nr:hypothetical protein JHK87_043987 [Glycine soja]